LVERGVTSRNLDPYIHHEVGLSQILLPLPLPLLLFLTPTPVTPPTTPTTVLLLLVLLLLLLVLYYTIGSAPDYPCRTPTGVGGEGVAQVDDAADVLEHL